MHDGVNKVWILRRDGGLSVDGYKDDLGAIDFGPDDMRARIEATVAKALTHLDEGRPTDETDGDG